MPVSPDQDRLGSGWERTVLGAHDAIDPQVFARELGRYRWASERILPGMSVLEFGCSSGFGTRLLPADIEYTGCDYNAAIIEYATEQFGGPRRTFVASTIDAFLDAHKGQTWDVVIAFEVLEHVKNGREVAQRLKQFGTTVLLTTPYREPVGFWGPHHVLHGLQERDFPQFKHQYMHIDGSIHTFPTVEIANLLLMEWHAGEVYQDRKRVLCCVPTRGRYDALFQCLQSVAFQTVTPDKVIVYDDGAHADLREHPVGRYILPLLNQKKVDWEVVFTPGRGQHIAHQLANSAGYDYVWRLDDDCVAEPDTLERLLSHMREDVGGVGGAVYEMRRIVRGGTSKIEEFFTSGNVQWEPDHGVFDVDFLYSSFLYRAGIVDYPHDMSPASFHEETIFTHRLKRRGWRLVADTSIHTHHFKSPHGGTREGGPDMEWAYAYDHAKFMTIMEREWGIKLIHLGVGLGDNLAFLNVLPELLAKYPTVIIGSCYPEVFEGQPVKIIPYDAAKTSSKDNVYDFAAEHHWQRPLVEAFRELYTR